MNPLRLPEVLLSQAINIYPNPNSGEFILEGMEYWDKSACVCICNAVGNMVMKMDASGFINGKTAINLANVPSGIYFLKVSGSTGNASRKVVISK